MCRYAETTYKAHFACFDCRKTFKRRRIEDIGGEKGTDTSAKCPQCGRFMADMGLDFASPRMEDVKAWSHLKELYTVGITFHSCGCGGTAYIPKDSKDLRKHLEEILRSYQGHLKHWQITERSNPESGQAVPYWIDRIKEVDARIKLLR